MELRQLRTFMCVAQLRSFTRAASQLHVAQPALSRQIRNLEEELDVVLFERHARGVELTDAGVMLQKRAEKLLGDIDEMREQVRGAGDGSRGSLTIAMPPVAGSIFLPPFLARMNTELPQVSFHFLEGLSSALQEWIPDERVDFVIMHNPPPLRQIKVHALVREPMYVVSAKGSGLPQSGCRLHDLQGVPLILPAHPHFNRLLIEQAATQYNLRLNIALEVDGAGLTRDLAALGFGHGFMTQASANTKARAGTLVATRLIAPQLYSELALVHTTSLALTPIHLKAIAILKETVADLVAGKEWLGAELP